MFGKKGRIEMRDLEAELELPMEEDENVGDGAPKKKKAKRKKTAEERAAERRVVFWTLLTVVGVTLLFWLWPRLKTLNFWTPTAETKSSEVKKEGKMPKWKNYVEYKL